MGRALVQESHDLKVLPSSIVLSTGGDSIPKMNGIHRTRSLFKAVNGVNFANVTTELGYYRHSYRVLGTQKKSYSYKIPVRKNSEIQQNVLHNNRANSYHEYNIVNKSSTKGMKSRISPYHSCVDIQNISQTENKWNSKQTTPFFMNSSFKHHKSDRPSIEVLQSNFISSHGSSLFTFGHYSHSNNIHSRQYSLPAHKGNAILPANLHQQQSHRSFSLSPKGILDASPRGLQPYMRLIRFDKPIGTWLLYWPCTWSIALAATPGHLPDLWLLTLFGLGSFFMRGAGCIINDMWDKDIDRKVERTKLRPLASGELSTFQGLVCLGTMLSVSLGILLQLNWYSVILGASSMGLVIIYPLAKRYTYWPQALLGVTLNWGVLLAWSAINGCVQAPVLPLYIACVFYTMIYDSVYSHQDKYDDLLIGVKSTALKFGDDTKKWLSAFGVVMTTGLTVTGIMCDQTWPYFLGVAVTATHLAHQLYTVNLDNADDCAAKFRSNTQLGFVMFLAVVLGTLLKKKEDDKAPGNDVKAGS